MANDLNQCNFIGRLGKEPETKFTASGVAITNFSIAVGSKWKDKQTGQPQERTEWINIDAFGKLAEICGEYLTKGSKVFITGEMVTRKWQDQSGADRYTTTIKANNMQMLDSRGDNSPAPEQAPRQAPQYQPPQQQMPAPPPQGQQQGQYQQQPQQNYNQQSQAPNRSEPAPQTSFDDD